MINYNLTTITTPLIREILSLINVMEETTLEFCCRLTEKSENDEKNQLLFNDLETGTSILLQYYDRLKPLLGRACYLEMSKNISHTLFCVADLINTNQDRKAIIKLKYQLCPILQELSEEIYFWGVIYPNPDAMKLYYKQEFALHHANSYIANKKPKYKLSFFIPVYNKLEYTKQCLSSIFQNTELEKFSYEFILLNDGSSDDTQDYFDSLNFDKIIELKENVKTTIFSLAYRICEGEYFLFINNDTLVTKGWLDNLITCIESDPTLISATPCTPNTSNYQSDMDGFYTFTSLEKVTNHFNQSNPLLWEERARIMPVIAIYRSALVNQIGFSDRLFYTMEFWDDDFSLRARRAGYKQMLCRDTYCYHFGSVTGKEAQVKNNTLADGRKLFQFKNHMDPWDRDYCYDRQIISMAQSAGFSHFTGTRITILAIDCGFGDTPRQLINLLRKNIGTGFSKSTDIMLITAYMSVNEQLYAEDLKSVSQQCFFKKDWRTLFRTIGENCLDFIYVGKPLETYEDYNLLLELAVTSLKKDGRFLFSASNIYYKPFLESLLMLSFPENSEFVRFLNIASLQKKLTNLFSNMECATQPESQSGVEEFEAHHLTDKNNPTAKPLLSSKYLKFCCQK